MKKLRFLSFAALLMALVFSAFTTPVKKTKSSDPFWYYTLSTTAGESDRTNYAPLTDQDGACPGQSDVYCVIQAPEYGSTNTPDLTNMDGVISNKP